MHSLSVGLRLLGTKFWIFQVELTFPSADVGTLGLWAWGVARLRAFGNQSSRFRRLGFQSSAFLVHGWDRIKHVHFYSLLGLSTHKNAKCYPTMVKVAL